MSYGNRFAQLTTAAADNAAGLVLSQLSGRLSLSKHRTNKDEEMECLQFGICSYQVRVHGEGGPSEHGGGGLASANPLGIGVSRE